jgi:IS4 transposase
VDRPDKDTPFVLVTNDFNRGAGEIALLYKQRWAIELFFKLLKQTLKIKRFIGQSENAVRIKLYTP